MKSLLGTILVLSGLLYGKSVTSHDSKADVACQKLRFVPPKPHVGDRLWVRFDVTNLSAVDIPGESVEVFLYLDGRRVIWSEAYPSSLKAHRSMEHSVAEQYMDPLTRPGPHRYKLVARLKNGMVDSDTTNNTIEGVLHVLK